MSVEDLPFGFIAGALLVNGTAFASGRFSPVARPTAERRPIGQAFGILLLAAAAGTIASAWAAPGPPAGATMIAYIGVVAAGMLLAWIELVAREPALAATRLGRPFARPAQGRAIVSAQLAVGLAAALLFLISFLSE